MHLKRLKYTLVAMVLITSMVLTAAITTGNTLAMIIDETLALVNTFVPSKIEAEARVSIGIQKIVMSTGVNGINAGGFTFELTEKATQNVLVGTSNTNGLVDIPLTFTEEDIGKTFTYTLEERNDGRKGFTYSDKVYQIDVTVSLVDNDLVADVKVDGKPLEELTLEFVNVYEPDSDEPPPPPAGDSGMPLLYLALALLSLGCIVIIYRKQKKSC